MRLSIKTNEDEVLKALEERIRTITTVAVPRALNKLIDQAQVAGVRLASENYNVSRGNMLKYGRFSYERASPGDPSAALVITGATFPLWIFPHRFTSIGVNVTLHKKTFSFPHAFRIKSRGDKVYARGSYNSAGGQGSRFVSTGEVYWRFQYGKLRFPISIVKTMSPPGIFQHDDVNEAMLDRMTEQAPVVMLQEIKFALSR